MQISGHQEWRLEEPVSSSWFNEVCWSAEESWSEITESPAECHRLPLEPEVLLAHIFDAIVSSQRILDLADDWDDEGSMAYNEATWRRATEFVRSHALWVWEHLELVVDAPRITPGPEGSIDVHWEDGGRELLVNVPASPTSPITFYGDDKGETQIKGALSGVARDHGLLVWLTKAK